MSGVELKPCGLSGGSNILVPLGSTTIGRGPFLGVADKRVSRNHAVLEIEDGNLRIKPIHVNPTFFSKHGESKLRPLKKDDWKELENGDRIGLTPYEHIFEAVIDLRPIMSVTQSPRSSIGSASPIKSPFKISTSDTPLKPISADLNTDVPSPARKKLDFPEKNENMTDNKETRNGNDEESGRDSKDEDAVREDDHSQIPKETPVPLPEKDTHKEYAKPVDRTRELPAWMMRLSSSNNDVEPASPAPAKKTKGKAKVAVKAKRKVSDEVSDDEDERAIPQVKKRAATHKKETAVSHKVEKEDFDDKEEVMSPAKRRPGRPGKANAVSYKEDEDEYDEPPPKVNRTSSRGRKTTSVNYVDEWDEDDDYNDKDDDDESDWEEQSSPSKRGRGKGKSPQGRGRKKRGRKSYSDEGSSEDDVYIPKPTKRTAKLLSDSQKSSEDGSQRPSKRRRDSDSEEEKSETGKCRERCIYGLKCYRKNPLHFKEFCHPGDDDFASETESLDVDEEDKQDCPYGQDCYRDNAEHQKKYNHSEATRRTQRKTTKGKKGAEDDSDEDGPNTYDYDDSFLDDEKKEDTQESKTSIESDNEPEVAEDSEDLNQLIKEGKDFVTNKKLQKT